MPHTVPGHISTRCLLSFLLACSTDGPLEKKGDLTGRQAPCGGPYQYVFCAAGRNAFDGYTPSVPEGERLDFGSDRFMTLEGRGLAAAADTAFVLVAGGLGERLGYQGERPAKVATACCGLHTISIHGMVSSQYQC